MQKPTKPCLCGANDWWQRPDGGWNCGQCHPNPNTVVYAPEVLALRDRIRLGNDKLFAAWLQIRDIEDKEEREYQFQQWDEAKEKLNLLRLELRIRGYRDCLYLDENGKKTKSCLKEPGEWFCNTCPSDREYWVEELMELPGPRVKRSDHGAEQREFLEKLGGKE
ncbi:hypothetical protein ES703_61648 [subsurface metagenome]